MFEKKYSVLLTKSQPVITHIRKDIARKMMWSAKYANEVIEFMSMRLQDWSGLSVS
ncbi:unnamed protein product [Gongylonema pulchrum]|uniref:Transposase n=1 Tax=Gongylonema pulchrum TaxID=637853 RepID=A0A183DLV5_9BILA|nr:unnamed protein product [Gongylonema pulchrum]